MPIKILMPALSPTMTEGNLVKWNKKEGDKIESGQVIAEIETDKATMEVEAADEGILGKILVQGGTKAVKVNTVLALILEEGEDASALDKVEIESSNTAVTDQPVQNTPEQPKATQVSVEETHQVNAASRVFASPLAKRIASQNNIDLSKISGSGPRGRIVKADLSNVSASKGCSPLGNQVSRITPESQKLEISSMRDIIAKRLTEAKQQVPHFYLSIDCQIDKLLDMRAQINSAASNSDKPEWRISVNDLVVKAVALAFRKVPEANAAWNGNSIIQHNNIDVSVAVAIKDGLITPIVQNADQKSVFAISSEIKQLVGKAKAGTLKPAEFQGGSTTVSNLGMYGVKQFNAIINPPQSAIFAIGAGQEVPGVVNGIIEPITVMNVTLSCDHRIVDGAVGAQLLQAFKDSIENPSRLLI